MTDEKVEMARAARDAVQERVGILRSRQTELDVQIDGFIEKARTGDVSVLEEMEASIKENNTIKESLSETERELADRELTLVRAENEANTAQFWRVIAEARGHKADFIRHFRAACLSWGSFCVAIDEATNVGNSLERAPFATAWLHVTNAIRELTEKIDPFFEWETKGHIGNYGWNVTLPAVVPMVPKFCEPKSQTEGDDHGA